MVQNFYREGEYPILLFTAKLWQVITGESSEYSTHMQIFMAITQGKLLLENSLWIMHIYGESKTGTSDLILIQVPPNIA